MTDPQAQAVPDGPLDALLSADDLRRLVAHHDLEKSSEHDRERAATRDARQARIDALRERRPLTPDAIRRALQRWENAAGQGATEVELLRFPSEMCSDDGRAINNGEAGWGGTLTGFPAQIYEIWDRNLRARGFRLKAYVVDFPGGKPGDVGIFLSWG